MTTQLQLMCHLTWDSKFFGVPIAKTLSARLRPHEVEIILRQCEQSNVKCLYCELDPQEIDTLAYMQQRGFTFVEFRMVLQHNLQDWFRSDQASTQPVLLDECPRETDLADLLAIADAISPMSRFAVDRHFGPDASRRLYARWLQNSLEDATVKMIVARVDDKAVGFVTLQPDGDVMHLTLLGVVPAARGRGIGAQLAQAAVRASVFTGASRLDVVTQGRNVGAIRTYERAGFTVAAGSYFFHKWWE